jgi:hypothetical protein
VTGCAEKYMSAFNIVGSQVIARAQAQGGIRRV